MVVSQLALAMRLPLGLHTTDVTLYLREVIIPINTNRERTIKKLVKNYQKTYKFECPFSVDWQSPDCAAQILMVWSALPLAIFFPPGLHATEKTLKL